MNKNDSVTEMWPLSWWKKLLVVTAITYYFAYIVIRAVYTLNADYPAYSWLFWFADTIGFVSTLCFAISVFKLRKRASPVLKSSPTVDVYIPTYNEPAEILTTTIFHCVNMDYPHKTYVLDDGKRPEIKKLAEDMGAIYIARTDNKGAKAGNINHAMKLTSGQIIAVFDADGVPRKDFLTKLLGYFEDKSVALVQTPQTFYNVDSFQHVNGSTEKIVWHEQSLFFDVIQSGRDYRGATMCCGSGSVYRRSSMEDVGNWATETVTEDLHTTLKLHMKGYKTVYHNEPVAFCLAPSSVIPFIVQRGRWALGTVQMLRHEWRHIFGPSPLTLGQRAAYLTATYYFTAIQRLLYYLAPIMYFAFGVSPIAGDEWIVMLIATHLILSIVNFKILSRGRGVFFMSEVFFTFTLASFLKSILVGLLPFMKTPFKVTSKSPAGKTPFFVLWPSYLLVGVSAASCFFGAVAASKSLDDPGIFLALAFAWFHFGVGMVSIFILGKKPLSDESYSFFDYRPMKILELDGKRIQGQHAGVANVISEQTMRFVYLEQLKVGSTIKTVLSLPKAEVELSGKILDCRVRFQGDFEPFYEIEIGFDKLSKQNSLELIRYFFEDATPGIFADVEKAKPNKKGQDQRTHSRAPTLVPVFLSQGPTGTHKPTDDSYMALLLDLSENGARIKAPVAQEIGSHVEIHVPWVKHSVISTVVRCIKEENAVNPSYFLGLEFKQKIQIIHRDKLALLEEASVFPGELRRRA